MKQTRIADQALIQRVWYEFLDESSAGGKALCKDYVLLSVAEHTRRRKFDDWLQKRGLCLSKIDGSTVCG